MEVDEGPNSWATLPSVGQDPAAEPYGMDDDEDYDEPSSSSTYMVGSKRSFYSTTTSGPRSSPRFKKPFAPSTAPSHFFGNNSFYPMPAGLSGPYHQSPAMLPTVLDRHHPIAVECSRDTAHTNLLVVKADHAPLGSGGGLVGFLSESQRCRDALTVAHSLLRLRGAELSVCLGRSPNPDMLTQQKRPVQVRLDGPLASATGASPGAAMLLALLQHYLGISLRPSVAVTGEVCLTGRVVSTGGAAAKVQAALAAGMACVVLPRDDEGEVERDLTQREKAVVVYAHDVLDLLQHTASGFFKRQADVSSLERDVGIGPTLLPYDDVLMAFRWVEAAALSRGDASSSSSNLRGGGGGGGGGGSFIMTGVQDDGNCVRSALNAARFLLLKHHAAITQLLGPPVIDLQYMRRCCCSGPAGAGGPLQQQGGAVNGPVDIHLHVPQPLHTAAYAVPALLALITVVWGKDPIGKTVSLGEVNMLGKMEFKGMLRSCFVTAVRMHRMRKVIIPRLHALELVRDLGGVGDRWAGGGGVVVQGVDGLLDLVRHAFMGGDAN